jgi:hypothetical protein
VNCGADGFVWAKVDCGKMRSVEATKKVRRMIEDPFLVACSFMNKSELESALKGSCTGFWTKVWSRNVN